MVTIFKITQLSSAIDWIPSRRAPACDEMSVETFLRFICEARDLRGNSQVKALSRVIDMMSLSTVLNQRIQTISKGFKRRVGLAQAILHDPKVLILDEPTDGLDPNQKHEVRKMIRNLSKDKIVVVSTHILRRSPQFAIVQSY